MFPSVALYLYKSFKFGSVEEQVEAHGYDFQEDIPRVCDELGLPRAFDTKAGRFTIEGKHQNILIVKLQGHQTDLDFLQTLTRQTSPSGSHAVLKSMARNRAKRWRRCLRLTILIDCSQRRS